MSKELIVSTGRHETRVAVLEDDQIVELFHEREKEYSLAGSIHKGRVTRVLPGMQSAFVDIGLERDAFLYVSDFFEDNEEYDAVVSGVEEKILKMEKGERVAEPPAVDFIITAISETVVITGVSAPASAPEARQEPQRPANDRSSTPRTGDRPQSGPADSSGNRGNNGRRGRRRRGGRPPGGIPDSKFYSPKDQENDQQKEREEERAEDARVEPQPSALAARPQYSSHPSSHLSPSISYQGDDFMVLPGESLAKYSAADLREDYSEDPEQQPEVVEPEVEELSAVETTSGAEAVLAALVEEPPAEAPASVRHEEPAEHPVTEAHVHAPESALPFEHPLAGLGSVPAWVPVSELPVPEPPVSELPASEPVQASVAAPSVATPDEAPTEREEDSSLFMEGEAIETAAEIGEADTEGDTQPNAALEGPEPARIPTSLTATLREQGHRYPHRVSRRMRRKMRGGQPGETQPIGDAPSSQAPSEGQAKPAEIAPPAPAPAEARQVEVREERQDRPARGERRPDGRTEGRPERGGGDRGNRGGERGGERTGERTGERSDRNAERGGERGERPERERTPLPSISDLLKEGQEIIVQIAKEPLGQKGARITSHIALPGRFVVYMPTVDHVGVSRKIPSDEERQRLKKVLQTHRQGIPGGFICRTAGEGKTEEELKSDMHFLYNLWLDMRQKAEKKPAPVLLHHDLDLVERVLRDQLTSSFKTIWVDNEEYYESILRFVQRFQPALVGRVKLYTRATPIFDEFGVTNEVEKALRPKVWLKSGGYIVINQTEALVAIDINTGKYVGKSNRLEDTIVKINTDAIKEIVRQIRLRDLGGIIVVDFIDMDERKNRQKVMQSLEEAMRADRAPYKILQFNDFGLVAITRKRVKQSLERTLCSPCPYCEGAGYVKSVGTVIGEILQEAQRIQKSLDGDDVTLRVNPEVAKLLKSNQNTYLQEVEEILGRTVLVKNDPLLHQTKFDLA